MDRRTFLENSSKVIFGAGFAGSAGLNPQSVFSKDVSANEKITIALIGCRGVGWSNLQSHLKQLGVECIALCDVDQNILDKRSAELEEATGQSVDKYGD